MREYRKSDETRERMNANARMWYRKHKDDTDYQNKKHKYRLTHYANYLRTFGYTVNEPKEE